MREAEYQKIVIDKLGKRFPGCVVLKNDSGYKQGIPDLSVFYRDQWAMLEVKIHKAAVIQPNQAHYVAQLDAMSFAAFIYPENEEEVFDGLEQAFRTHRATRLPKS